MLLKERFLTTTGISSATRKAQQAGELTNRRGVPETPQNANTDRLRHIPRAVATKDQSLRWMSTNRAREQSSCCQPYRSAHTEPNWLGRPLGSREEPEHVPHSRTRLLAEKIHWHGNMDKMSAPTETAATHSSVKDMTVDVSRRFGSCINCSRRRSCRQRQIQLRLLATGIETGFPFFADRSIPTKATD